ncbi:MAG: YraN family protein [bacterium]|nr:YraN family protein [bacterium]
MQYGRYDRQRFRHSGEARALAYVEERGHILLRHNYHTRFCEIDLITAVPSEDFRLHAIEVKTWRSRPGFAEPFVHPLRSLNPRKQAKMRRAMESFRLHAARNLDFRVGSTEAAIDEPAWVLAQAGCVVGIDELDVSFDLLWLSGHDAENETCEFFTDLF